jgi:hypothetical protein
MTSTVDVLAELCAHLSVFELPGITSVHVADWGPAPEVTVQLSCREPSAIAGGLLAWADTLAEATAQAWRVPQGNSVHVSVTGLLPSGASVRVYRGLRNTDCRLGAGLEPDTTTAVPLATLRYLATSGHATDEVAL